MQATRVNPSCSVINRLVNTGNRLDRGGQLRRDGIARLEPHLDLAVMAIMQEQADLAVATLIEAAAYAVQRT